LQKTSNGGEERARVRQNIPNLCRKKFTNSAKEGGRFITRKNVVGA